MHAVTNSDTNYATAQCHLNKSLRSLVCPWQAHACQFWKQFFFHCCPILARDSQSRLISRYNMNIFPTSPFRVDLSWHRALTEAVLGVKLKKTVESLLATADYDHKYINASPCGIFSEISWCNRTIRKQSGLAKLHDVVHVEHNIMKTKGETRTRSATFWTAFFF